MKTREKCFSEDETSRWTREPKSLLCVDGMERTSVHYPTFCMHMNMIITSTRLTAISVNFADLFTVGVWIGRVPLHWKIFTHNLQSGIFNPENPVRDEA